MDNRLEITEDGSHTVRSGQFDIHYHSRHGAIQESEHVFINAGLRTSLEAVRQPQLNILELGLGTGLNVLLSMREAAKRPEIKFQYRVVELYPISLELAEQLNYSAKLDLPKEWMAAIHNAAWDEEVSLLPNFLLHKQAGDWLELVGDGPSADVVYYDAFAPNAQAELWSEEAFALLAKAMKAGSVWVSYCAKGAVKRALKANGFSINALPGPPGKREMTQAIFQG